MCKKKKDDFFADCVIIILFGGGGGGVIGLVPNGTDNAVGIWISLNLVVLLSAIWLTPGDTQRIIFHLDALPSCCRLHYLLMNLINLWLVTLPTMKHIGQRLFLVYLLNSLFMRCNDLQLLHNCFVWVTLSISIDSIASVCWITMHHSSNPTI